MARHFTAAASDYIDCGTGVRGSDVQRLSVSAWVNLDDVAAGYAVVARFDGTVNESWILATSAGGQVNWVILATDLNAYGQLSASSLTPGVWTQIGGSYDGATLKTFVGGAVDGSNTISKTMKTGTLPMLIGRNAGGAFLNGSVAEVSVQLDVTNVEDVMAAQAEGWSPKDTEGLSNFDHIGYWPLLGDSPEPDYSGNNHPGTVHGTTLVDHPPVRSILAFSTEGT